MERSQAVKGMEVIFGRGNGEQTRGRIVKCNPKNAKIEQLESRGQSRVRPVGTVWTVPYSLMTPANGASAPKPSPTPLTTASNRSFSVRDRVEFTNKGSVISGVVMRVNRKTIAVKPDSETGSRYWRISPGLLRHATGNAPVAPPKPASKVGQAVEWCWRSTTDVSGTSPSAPIP